MPKIDKEFRDVVNEIFDHSLDSALLETVMEVLIAKHDAGKRTAYTYQGRKFEIILKEMK
jgi:hypothetical protein